MTPRRLQHREGAVDIGAKIGFRLLDRRHDVGARRQMKDALDALARRHHRSLVGDVGLDHLEPRIVACCSRFVAAADDKIVEHAHMAALAISRSTRWLPMNPAPPVTRSMFIV